MTDPKPWQLVVPEPHHGKGAGKRLDPRGWKSIVILVVVGSLLAALHLIHPEKLDIAGEIGRDFTLLIFSAWIVVPRWRERRSDMPTAVAWMTIWWYAALYVFVGVLMLHRMLPWFLRPYFVMVALLLAVAVSPRPQSARTD